MKKNRKFELGRSMTEMIGVLGVVAVLVIASLGGFSFVMVSWRQRQSIDQVNALALGMRAGNLAVRYKAGDQIPVKTIVRGLRESGIQKDAAALPDSDESYALVRSLGVNQYMLEVDVTPGTCEEFLDKLVDAGESARGLNPDIVQICNGTLSDDGECSVAMAAEDTFCSSGSCTLSEVIEDLKKPEKLAGRTREAVLASICTNRPKTALIWGCAEGAGDYWYNGQCHKCPRSKPKWDGKICCTDDEFDQTTGKCKKTCQAPTPYWWEDGRKCVECLENSHCPSNQFTKHICDTSKHVCVECLEDQHCTENSPNLAPKDDMKDPSPRDDNWSKMLCSVNKKKCYQCLNDGDCPQEEVIMGRTIKWDGVCLQGEYLCSPCIKSYQGQTKLEHGECPSDAPYCENPGTPEARCTPCTPDLVWNIEKQQCHCENGAIPECDDFECREFEKDENGQEVRDEFGRPKCKEGAVACTHYVCDTGRNSCVEWNSNAEDKNNGCSVAGSPADTCVGPKTEANKDTQCHNCVLDYKKGASHDSEGNVLPERCGVGQFDKNKPLCDSACAASSDGGVDAGSKCENREWQPKHENFVRKADGTWVSTSTKYGSVSGQTFRVQQPGYKSAYVCRNCLLRVHTSAEDTYGYGRSGRPDFGCAYDAPVCDEDAADGLGACSCSSTSRDCLPDMYCEADPVTLMHPKTSGQTKCLKCEDKKAHTVRAEGKDFCECAPGYHKVCTNGGLSDVTGKRCGGALDASWECKPGCVTNGDCGLNNFCDFSNSTDRTAQGVKLGQCKPCPSATPIRGPNDLMCNGCLCGNVADAQNHVLVYNEGDKAWYIKNTTTKAQPHHCDSSCNANQICLENNDCTATVSGGTCKITEKKPGRCVTKPSEMFIFHGVTDKNRTYYTVPPSSQYRMSWAEAGAYCTSIGLELASCEEACLKNMLHDSGYDCPNITAIRERGTHSQRQVVGTKGTKRALIDWQVEDYGAFWLDALLPGECNSLRVSATCGNNHKSHVCKTAFYPLCTGNGYSGQETIEALDTAWRESCTCGTNSAGTQCASEPQNLGCGITVHESGNRRRCTTNAVPTNCKYGYYYDENQNKCTCNTWNCPCKFANGRCMTGCVDSDEELVQNFNGTCECKPKCKCGRDEHTLKCLSCGSNPDNT